MTPDEYLQLMDDLHNRLTDNPTTALALTVGWLDPLVVLDDVDRLQEQDLSDFYDAGDGFGAALSVARDCFPGTYAEVVSQIRNEASDQQAVAFISGAITEQTGLPVDDYEEPYAFAFGIPLPYHGFDLDDPDFVRNCPRERDLLCLLGATLDETAYYASIDVDAELWDIAHLLQWSLWPTQDNPVHRAIMWALAYCCSNSGNSSVDMSYEVAYEWEPLSWTPAEVEFAIEIVEEAQEIMTHALNGLDLIQSDRAIQEYLERKVTEARSYVKSIKAKGLRLREHIKREQPNPFNLRWDDLHRRPDGDATTDPELL